MRMRSASYPGSVTTTAANIYGLCANSSAAGSGPSSSPAPKKPTTATRVPKFLRCLYDILHNEDQAILSWSADGTHFQIYNTPRLEVEILPKYFKHGKFASFQRQLNNFGFRKWTKTQSNVCTFSHHHYVRRHPQQLVELVIQQNELAAKTEEADAPVAKQQAVGSHSAKRKRTETDAAAIDVKPTKAMKKEPTVIPLIKLEEAPFDFEVESWSLMADVRPLEWATKSHMIKTECGNETPTSASGFASVGFDFTMEELDDLLLTTTGASGPVQEEQHTLDMRLLQDTYASVTSGTQSCLGESAMTWDVELFGKSELEMYMQDSELWATPASC